MALRMWIVGGSIVVPGSRDKAQFGPVRVFAATRQMASRDLAPLLQDRFGKEATTADRRQYVFSPNYALMNLNWTEQVKTPEAVVAPELTVQQVAAEVAS